MRRNVSTAGLLVLITLVAFAYIGCANQQNQNTNANTAALPSVEPTPDKAAIEAELTRLENDWPRILKERDGAAVRKLEADDIVLVYPDGANGSKDEDIKDIESGALSTDPQEISDITVNILDNDSAVVRSRTTVRGDNYKITDGKCQFIVHEFRSVDTFARRNGQWLLVASATVPVRNPTPTTTPLPTPKSSASLKPSPSVKSSPAAKASPVVRPTPVRTASPIKRPSPQ